MYELSSHPHESWEVTGRATQKAAPADAVVFMASVTGGVVSITLDGSAPTEQHGFILSPGTAPTFFPFAPRKVRAIRVGNANARLTILWLKLRATSWHVRVDAKDDSERT
jgi:hypothetical protein